jgi:hypothetical protein
MKDYLAVKGLVAAAKDCEDSVAQIDGQEQSMTYGCFSGLHYVMLLWFEKCDCLCIPQ